MNRAVFLDRDNTLIKASGDVGDPERVTLMEGVAEGLRSLRRHGFRLIVTTNQAGVARGHFTEDDVDAVHQRIAHLVDEQARASNLIDRFYYCPFHPEGSEETYRREHPWRMPNPGMLLQAAQDLDIDLSESWLIGDDPTDVAAGRSAGCRTVLVSGDAHVIETARPWSTAIDFREAVDRILGDVQARGSINGAGKHHDRRGAAHTDDDLASDAGHDAIEGGTAADGQMATSGDGDSSTPSRRDALTRNLNELLEELRTERMRRAEFTVTKMGAGICQMLVMLFVLLALLQLESLEVFIKWMSVAALGQLVVMSLLLLDARS